MPTGAGGVGGGGASGGGALLHIGSPVEKNVAGMTVRDGKVGPETYYPSECHLRNMVHFRKGTMDLGMLL